jgi:hypothetical protein
MELQLATITISVLHDGKIYELRLAKDATAGEIGAELMKTTGTFVGCRLFQNNEMVASNSKCVSDGDIISVRVGKNPYPLHELAFDAQRFNEEDGVCCSNVDVVDDEDDDDDDNEGYGFFHEGVRSGDYVCPLHALILSYFGGAISFQSRDVYLVENLGVHHIHFDVEIDADPHNNRDWHCNDDDDDDVASFGVCRADGSGAVTPLTLTADSAVFRGTLQSHIVRVHCSMDIASSTVSATARLRCDTAVKHVRASGQVGGEEGGSGSCALRPPHYNNDISTDNEKIDNDDNGVGFRWFVRCQGSIVISPCAMSWSKWVA